MNLAFVVIVAFLCKNVIGYLEKVTASGCESCALRLTCRHFDSIIAILDVRFESSENSSLNLNSTPAIIPIQPRAALNQRCSGVNHCSFILTKDCPGASTLGLGNLTISYFCVAAPELTKHCNKEIISLPSRSNQGILEGFVHNPGYPRFYLGKEVCQWKIRALPRQKIKITLYDISLLGSSSDNCTDVLQIKESEHIIFSTCMQEEFPLEILSVSNTLEVFLNPSSKEDLIPRRGVLFHYTSVGCFTPSPPQNAHLVARNETIAEFSCNIDYAFPDTQIRTRTIRCIGNHWNEQLPLPDCDNETALGTIIPTVNLHSRHLKTIDAIMTDKTTLQEVLAPTLIMVLLFIVNALVLVFIYRYKKRKESEFTEEELGVLSGDKVTNPKA